MTFENALEILKENNHRIYEHDGWGGYTVYDEEGEDISYGGGVLDEEDIINYVENYLI